LDCKEKVFHAKQQFLKNGEIQRLGYLLHSYQPGELVNQKATVGLTAGLLCSPVYGKKEPI
jgi:hypothetical protein